MTSKPDTEAPPRSEQPHPLPDDAVACRTCGVAVPLRPGTPTGHRDLIPTTHRYPDGSLPHAPRVHRQTFARCDRCAEHHALAAAILEAHPALARKMGGRIAADRVEAALVALAALEKPAPDPATLSKPEVGRMIRFLAPEGDRMRWISRAEDAPGHAMPYPYAHADPADVQRLTVAWNALVVDRTSVHNPPVLLAPPALTRHDLPSGAQPIEGGCLLCGVGTVAVPSQAVARAGGTAPAAADTWTLRPACGPEALGGRRSPVRLRGYSCPDCTDAVERVGGVGPSTLERAVVVTLGLDHQWSDATTLSRVPGWGALVADALRRGQPAPAPNATPWAHLGDLTALRDRLAADLGVA